MTTATRTELRCPVCYRWLTPPGETIPPHPAPAARHRNDSKLCIASGWHIEDDDWIEPVCVDCGGEGGFSIDGWEIGCSTCDSTGLAPRAGL